MGGIMMIKLSGILLAIHLFTSCGTSLAKSVIPFKVERNRTLVSVTIGNVVVPNILLDTGFPSDGLFIYSPKYRELLDLGRAREIRMAGAGSGAASKASVIDSAEFTLGDIEMKNQRLLVLQSDTFKGFPSNGIIGYSVFGHYVTKLDYDQQTMTLFDSDEARIDDSWAVIPLFFKGNKIPWVDIAVVINDEQPITLSTYIDYAAGDAIVFLERPGMKLRIPGETADVYIGRGLSGDIYGKTGRISKLVIGPFELKDVKASFAPAEVRSKQKNADAVLGNRSLSRFNLIFDYARKKLYLKPNAGFDKPFN
jgi:hypothetical protein